MIVSPAEQPMTKQTMLTLVLSNLYCNNCHHFHKRTQSTLEGMPCGGDKGQFSKYSFGREGVDK